MLSPTQIELQAKLLNYFLGSNKSNINQSQSGSSSWEPSPMLPLGRGRYHCTASRFSSGGAQPTWIRTTTSTTPLAETHGAGSRGGSASTQRPHYLPWQLGRQTEALIRRLYNKCRRDPLEKEAHRSWWETMVTLCRAALRKGKKVGPNRMTGQSRK